MTINNYKKFFGWMAASLALVLPTSCKDDTFSDFNNPDSDEVKVSFSIAPEAASVSTRGDYPSSSYKTGRIGDGGKADMLIYAIYEVGSEDEDVLQTYGEGVLSDEFIAKGIEAGRGQTIVKVDQYPYTVLLTLKKDVKYRIAFWAQNSDTKAYRTADLRKVEVVYSELDNRQPDDFIASVDDDDSAGNNDDSSLTTTPNNDESRDAFCRSVELTPTGNSMQQNVFLYRPLAQINVGTNGYDFEIINRERPRKFTYSKIRINRVARYLNVVKDKTYTTTTGDDPYTTDEDKKTAEAFAVIDYGYAPIPAYVNYPTTDGDDTSYDFNGLPKFPTYSKYDWKYGKKKNPDFKIVRDGVEVNEYAYNEEEFLRVKHLKRDAKGNIIRSSDPGVSYPEYTENEEKKFYLDQEDFLEYANYNNFNDAESETFKYLSMCYVLTSSTEEDPILLNNVKVWLATDESGKDEFEIININSVPAQRNWRTNIFGNLLSVEKYFEIKLDTDFAGDHSNWKGEEWNYSGQLAPGVYYDAQTDEIQISSVDGLIWFQQMVNGNMTVRTDVYSSLTYIDYVHDSSSSGISITGSTRGEHYWYYDESNIEQQWTLTAGKDYIDRNKLDKTTRERILIATHQKWNQNAGNSQYCDSDGWPKNGNFHFVGDPKKMPEGMKPQATVKLMADLDLSKYEFAWIPIGFDGKIYDTVVEGFNEANTEHRGFCGIFDGNFHTVSNVSTKRFGAAVHGKHQQKSGGEGPYDNPQWFGTGFFGQIGGDAKIKDLTLRNVDFYGCNGVGGIVGLAVGHDIEITGCTVDYGKMEVAPMYRGDSYETRDRTFARGVYIGGIVGYFHTYDPSNPDNPTSLAGRVDDNSIRNITMTGYRRIGGIIGSLGQKNLGDQDDKNLPTTFYEPKPKSISNNSISNSTIIASNYTAFGLMKRQDDGTFQNSKGDKFRADYTGQYPQTGFGWDASIYAMYLQEFVGGHSLSLLDRSDIKGDRSGNTSSGVTVSEFKIRMGEGKNPVDDIKYKRYSTIETTPLENMPMLSSWYADEIYLLDNFSGKPSAHKYQNLHNFNIRSTKPQVNGYYNSGDGKYQIKGYLAWGPSENSNSYEGNTYRFPMNLPGNVAVDWIEESPNVGIYVESVTLSGTKNPIGNRSVITPLEVTQEGSAVMYVTARNRHQFSSKGTYKKATVLKDLVLRGEPYAYTGLMIAPNKNMLNYAEATDDNFGVQLDNVNIYDVYQTIAIDAKPTNSNHSFSKFTWPEGEEYAWPNIWPSDMDGKGDGSNKRLTGLYVANSNLRGYTIPGAGWAKVKMNHTTFGQGGYYAAIYEEIDDEGYLVNPPEQSYTYKVECKTEFKDCFFKAPYIIDLSDIDNKNVSFTGTCQATSASTANVKIGITDSKKAKTSKIVITSDSQGNPIVSYYEVYNERGKENKLLVREDATNFTN